jgi:signal transduction histidine kinase
LETFQKPLEQDLKEVFSRFQAGRTVRTGGLGLGLSIAKTFAQAQGGDLIAKRKDAGGLCFELQFPIPEGAARVELE